MSFENGCNKVMATAINFKHAQITPAPLPKEIPSNVVAHSFDGDCFFEKSASGNLAQSLALIDCYLKCLGDVCNAQPGQIIVGNGSGMEFTYLASELLAQINSMLGDGQILIGSPIGTVVASLCNEVLLCLAQTSSEGQFFLNTGGAVRAVDFATYVQQYTGLDCAAVLQCLVQGTSSGQLLYNNGTSIVGVDQITAADVINSAQFCPGVEGCLLPLLNPGEVLGNVGGTLTGVVPSAPNTFGCSDVEACLLALLSPGQVLGNVGGSLTGTTPATGGTSFACADVLPCLDALTGSGQILYDDGTGLAPTDFASLLPAGTNPDFLSLADVNETTYAGNEGNLLAVGPNGGIEFITTLSEYISLSMTTPQTFPTGTQLSVELDTLLAQKGGTTNGTGGTAFKDITISEAGVYFVSWQMSVEGFINGANPDLVRSEISLDINGDATQYKLQEYRNYFPSGLHAVDFAGSGALLRPFNAGDIVDLDIEVSIDSGAAYQLTIVECHFAIGRFE